MFHTIPGIPGMDWAAVTEARAQLQTDGMAGQSRGH